MQEQWTTVYEILKELNFTNKEIAEHTKVTESMIKKVRAWQRQASSDLQKKIFEFVSQKVKEVGKLLP